MNSIEINALLIHHKIAKNEFQAGHIIRGLELWSLETEEEILARARLYRDWRNSKIFGKETSPCYEKAIKGEPVPVEPMFEGALLSKPKFDDSPDPDWYEQLEE